MIEIGENLSNAILGVAGFLFLGLFFYLLITKG
jgi:hypothetical protein